MNRKLLLTIVICPVILTMGVTAPCSLHADDLDQELLQSLQEENHSESVVTIVNRLLDNTQQAEMRLEESDFKEQTQLLQQQILDDIDKLMDMTSPPPGSPPPSSGQSEPQTQAGQPESSQSQQSEDDGTGGQQTGDDSSSPDPNEASRESEERNAQADGSVSEMERRLGLATAVWGHLPPKVREQMRSAFSETYLPEYDDLVRRYYEALATRRNRVESGDSESSK